MALTISVDWERTDADEPEERASFGLLKIASGPIMLTEGYDDYVRRLREGPLVSACEAAEWFVWNWWRLRWEPRTNREDWRLAHDMAAIGQGYIWPNISIQSDAVRVLLNAKPSTRAAAKPFRYITDRAVIVNASQFEAAIEAFVAQVLDRLPEEGIGDSETNLHRLWRDLLSERADKGLSLRRRLEALLGSEPDEGGPALQTLVNGALNIGSEAMAELAANEGITQIHVSLTELQEQAKKDGLQASFNDAVQIAEPAKLPGIGEAPAWKRGAEAARLLREQEHLGVEPLSNGRLEGLIGVAGSAAGSQRQGGSLSFLLGEQKTSYIVLASNFETGRRFQLARLLGDRLTAPGDSHLRLATHAATYRQKMQRSFAAELLCPFDALTDKVGNDFSAE